jgi:hydrogenase maturation protease
MRPLLVLCLGNEVLTDDSFGPLVASRFEAKGVGEDVELIFASVAGFSLLELLQGRKSVLIVDAILTGCAAPGTLHYFSAGILTPSNGLINSHQINLPTALALGKQMGMEMPDDIQVLAAEAEDIETLCEQPTQAVADAIEPAIGVIEAWINRKRREQSLRFEQPRISA